MTSDTDTAIMAEYVEEIRALESQRDALLAALRAVELARNTDLPKDWQRATEMSDAAIAKAEGTP